MSRPVTRFRLALGDLRSIRAIDWFVDAGVFCYLEAYF